MSSNEKTQVSSTTGGETAQHGTKATANSFAVVADEGVGSLQLGLKN